MPSGVDAIVIILADMVQVTAEMLRELVWRAGESDASIVASRYEDVLAPPLLFKRELFEELLAWNGEGCGKSVVKAHMEDAVFVDWPVMALEDVDTPEDWEEARRNA